MSGPQLNIEVQPSTDRPEVVTVETRLANRLAAVRGLMGCGTYKAEVARRYVDALVALADAGLEVVDAFPAEYSGVEIIRLARAIKTFRRQHAGPHYIGHDCVLELTRSTARVLAAWGTLERV